MSYVQTWELEKLLPWKMGGKVNECCRRVQREIEGFAALVTKSSLVEVIMRWQEVEAHLKDLGAYALCRVSQDTKDAQAIALDAEVRVLQAQFACGEELVDARLAALSEKEFKKLVSHKELKPLAAVLGRRRKHARDKMNPEFEMLASRLAVDGFHAWHALYNVAISTMQIPFKEGKKKSISAARAANLLAHPSQAVRKKVFTAWSDVCKDQESFFGQTLNHLAGFRLELYKQRKWDEALKEALFLNRMEKKSVEALWQGVAKVKAPFLRLFEVIAKKSGQKKLHWYDLEAPSQNNVSYSYNKAAEIIISSFGRFSKELQEFAAHALKKSWIDAEERPAKATGGFCIPFYGAKESRIFMSYSNTFSNLLVLAHELGHGYHNHVVTSLPSACREYPMTFAEMASTLCEQIVCDELIHQCKESTTLQRFFQERAMRSTVFFMNIHSRFLFEKSFYSERKHTFVTPKKLSEMMLQAQKKAYCNALDSYHPYFWITKLHFYLSDYPGYNFPYTVGYLLALSIYKRAREDKKWFMKTYPRLLQDTATMTVEELIKTHFNADATDLSFWEKAASVAVEDVDCFFKLSKKI